MLVDRVRIKVTGGGGGDGCCSFRREKYVPRGGPNGGDGGNGGDVYFEAQAHCPSLINLRYHAHWKGERGVHGQGSNCHGKRGAPQIIPVPPGTLVRDFHDANREIGVPGGGVPGTLRADLVEEGQRFLAARGGKGGRGNARFASATNKAPRFAELGEPGENAEYLLELKLIAEVGIVGLPNAGKSTFLSVVSNAEPKIADYPFTTLSPNLGIAELSDFRTLTFADIPGIIEGAAEGKGLGHDFLRHIERTKVLLFVVDLGDPEPAQTLATLENELASHSAAFAGRPRVIALNKADIPENRARFKKVARKAAIKKLAFPDSPFLISAATGEGVDPLVEHLWGIVDRLRRAPAETEEAVEADYTFKAPYLIHRTATGFRIEGARVRQAVSMTNFENDEAVRHLHHQLTRMGVFKALKRMGAEPGQAICIEDAEFEYHPD